MRSGVPTCAHPVDPQALYVRCMFHSFFYGPFADDAAVIAALRTLDDADPYWDYDSFAIHYGADPLPADYVGGFRFVTPEQRAAIEKGRWEGKVDPNAEALKRLHGQTP